MATVACGVGAAVGGCVALVLALPAYALKEVYEGRAKANIKRHLPRRRKCRVNFGNMEAPMLIETEKQRVECNPPLYGEIFARRETPPPPYNPQQKKNIEKHQDEKQKINELPKIPVAPLKSALKRRQ